MDAPGVHLGGAPQLAIVIRVTGARVVGLAQEGERENALLAHCRPASGGAGPFGVCSCSGGGSGSGGGG